MDVPFLVRDHPVEHRVLLRAGARRVEDRAGTTAVCEINQPSAGPGRSSPRTKVGVAVLPDLGSLLDHLRIDVPEALRNTRPRPSVRERWAESFSDGTGVRFAAIVAPNASLEGSIFAQPIEGRDAVWTALRASAGIYDAITFTAETSSAERTCLDWTAQALGLELRRRHDADPRRRRPGKPRGPAPPPARRGPGLLSGTEESPRRPHRPDTLRVPDSGVNT